MLVKNLVVAVHAAPDTLWQLLLDTVENPERFLPGITEMHVLEKQENQSLREMKLHGELVRERITVYPDDSEIRHELLEHPRFTGTIVARVSKTARQSPVAPQDLEYRVDLRLKSYKVKGVVYGEAETIADLEEEMRRLKSRAEEMEQRV